MTMKLRKPYLAGLAILLVFSGCTAKTTPTAILTPSALASTVTSYPGPQAVQQQSLPQVSNPYPGVGITPFSPYPQPQGVGQPPIVYPGPGVYPPPTDGTLIAQPEEVTPTATITLPPTATFTPRPTRDINKELHATDPSTVQLASGKVQLIELFAFWSVTCKAMAPIVHGLEAEYGKRMNFVYLDIDDPANDRFKEQLSFRFEPHFFLLDEKGTIIQQWSGSVKEDVLRNAIEAALT